MWALLILLALRSLEACLLCRVTAHEPPVVRSRLPILGHAVRLFRQGVTYYENLRKQTNLPILTTFLGTQKVYVVNSPDLIAQINRQGKKLDATLPFLFVVCGKFFGMRGADFAGLLRNATAKDSLRHRLKTLEHISLEAGSESMRRLHGQSTGEFGGFLNDLASCSPGVAITLSLRSWLQTTLALSMARAFLGRGNPLDQSADLVEALWTMESGLKSLTMLPFQSVMAPQAVAARERLVQAFVNDINMMDGQSSAHRPSAEMNGRIREISQRYSMSAEFQARYTIGLLTGFVINTVPTAFWTIGLLAADKDLADRIRCEVDQVVAVVGPDERLTVDAGSLQARCPLLGSTCREVLRYVSASISSFILLDDVRLCGNYDDDDNGGGGGAVDGTQAPLLLKKGALVQIAATAIHSNPMVWGPSASELNPERFLNMKREKNKLHPSADRVFGGGSSLCPGRHLALDGLLTITAMFVHTFDVTLSPETPQLPAQELTNMLSVKKPCSDLQIKLERRMRSQWMPWPAVAR